MSARRARSSATSQRAIRSKRGHQKAQTPGRDRIGPKRSRPISQQLGLGVVGQAAADSAGRIRRAPRAPPMPSSARPGSASSSSSAFEPQDVAGVDRVGIAQPGLDLGHRQPARPRGERRARLGRRQRPVVRRRRAARRPRRSRLGSERAVEPDRAQHRVEPQQPARRHGRHPLAARRAGQRHLRARRSPGQNRARRCRSRAPAGRCRIPGASAATSTGRGSAGPGQVPSLSPPRTRRSACCSRASRRPQIASRGWRP